MFIAEKIFYWKKGTRNKYCKWRYGKRKLSYKKELHTMPKNKEKSYTIETKFDKSSNKVSMYETIKEVYEETIIKEHITLLTKDNTTSIQSDNVEDIGKINNSLMI